MTRLIALALTFIALSPLCAQERFDYATALALAVERTQGKPESSIFILGPSQNEEFYYANGKELKRSIPYCVAISAGSPTTIERLRGGNDIISQAGNYQLLVYRPNSSVPEVRLQGDSHTLSRSQFPLKAGDILVITETPPKK